MPPVHEEAKLLGLWSVDVMYPPGAIDDTVLVVLPGHVGYLERINGILYMYDEFRWHVDGEGLLSIVSLRAYSVEEGRIVSHDGVDYVTGSRFSICAELTPSGKTMDVLTIESPLRQKGMTVPSKFGRQQAFDASLLKKPVLSTHSYRNP